jgi:hypothetical protein
LIGDVPFETRQDLAFKNLDQAGIDGLRDAKEGLSIDRVDPVIRGRPLAQSLARDVVARQLGLPAVVHPHMRVDVEDARLFGAAAIQRRHRSALHCSARAP